MCLWIVDADQIQMDDFNNRILYRNAIVDSFVYNDLKLGIEAPKGLGKTFLMKCKRMESQKSGVLCLPKDSMCDILDKVTFEESMSRYLEDYTNWVDLWKAAIVISIIKAKNYEDEQEKKILNMLSDDRDLLFKEIYDNPFIDTTCQIMNFLINSERARVRNLQVRIPVYMSIIKAIHQPIHIFIDKTDQALRDNLHFINGATNMSRGPSNNSYWAYGQMALAEASYQVFVHNSHIKVFYSIRSEALVGAESYTNVFLQVRSYMIKLDYNFYELKKIFQHYVSMEDDKWLVCSSEKYSNPEKAFIGIDVMEHGYVKDSSGSYKIESFFQYLFRHTLKRPRDIMHICYRLCYSNVKNLDNESDIKKEIRHVINKESRLILQAYLREMGPFIFDINEEMWDAFWKSLDTNVFSYEYTQNICKIVNNISGNCNMDCSICSEFKPFSNLYNTGLLGVVSNNNVEDDMSHITFKSTGETIIKSKENLLPQSPLYFLHPMVANKAEACRKENGIPFKICKTIIVGDEYEIEDEAISKIRRSEQSKNNQKKSKAIFLSSTCNDLIDCRKLLYKELIRNNYYVIMSERNDFGMPDNDENSYDYCLDKVKECNRLIFIIGERYGGVYRGEKYAYIADEIKKKNPALGEPSISLMEFYLARKLGIRTYVFTKKDIYNERNTYMKNCQNNSFTPAFAKDKRVFEIISLITRLEKGNWFKTYEDLDDLLEIIKIEFGE